MAKELRPRGHHPVSRAVARLHAELDQLHDVALFSMSPAENAATLTSLTALASRVAELELRVAAQSEENRVGEDTGAASAAVWWAQETRQTRPAAIGRMRLAEALGRHQRTRVALAAGDLVVDQARVITEALDALPDDLDPALVVQAEQHLLIEATRYDAKALRLLGKRLLTVIAPEIGEAADARALEREEAEAAASSWFTMGDDGHGSVFLKAKIPTLQGAMLRKALMAIAAPKHQRAVNGDYERKPSPERMGQAFAEYIERYPTDKLPHSGGVCATVVVLIPLESLTGGLAHAHLDTGEPISAAMARRLACEAGIIPAVLGSQSQVLDLGRKVRFHTEAQRLALLIEQTTCTAEGCDWPAYLCHTHHDHRWADGGHTNTKDARLLCPHHHARAHDPAYGTRRLPDGKVSFHRRT